MYELLISVMIPVVLGLVSSLLIHPDDTWFSLYARTGRTIYSPASYVGARKSPLNWYKTVNKSPLNPPNWIFGPVWTILYILMGISAYLVYKVGGMDALYIYAVQLALGFIWSPLFFGYHEIALSFIVILAMIVSVAIMIYQFYRIDSTAAYLQIPLICWLSFAAYLNFYVLTNN